ncbi:MAG: anaerobic ribonucleoside-triphosphate reductase activating protein [Erysipelotrichaceae bacterium]|nr:anaerobic ribonucleoside-triphosphate reductase activating protein [Erysipelotrichaceae bacterium]
MKYHNITKDDMLNGDGLRVVLWVSGCEHGCNQCHNQFTWNPNDGLDFDEHAKKEIFDLLDKDYISGITFSGGDPLYPSNREEIGKLINEIKQTHPHKTIWLYTGYDYEQISDLDFIKNIDVLVDGKFIIQLFDPQLHWKGSANQRVIDVQATLSLGKIVLHTN